MNSEFLDSDLDLVDTTGESGDLLRPVPESVSSFAGKMRWFVRLQKARREAEENMDQIKARIAELEPHLIEEMGIAGIDRQTVDGMTVFPQDDLIVSKKADKEGVTTEVLCDALRQCGCSYMIGESYSPSSLKSKVKEWKEQGIEIPAVLADKINVIEKVKLGTRVGR